jgi:hypothetical protein
MRKLYHMDSYKSSQYFRGSGQYPSRGYNCLAFLEYILNLEFTMPVHSVYCVERRRRGVGDLGLYLTFRLSPTKVRRYEKAQ